MLIKGRRVATTRTSVAKAEIAALKARIEALEAAAQVTVMTGPEVRARTERMFYMRQLGMPYAAIGAKFELTSSRIQQILKKREHWVAHQWRVEGVPECAQDLTQGQMRPREYAAVAAWSLSNILS